MFKDMTLEQKKEAFAKFRDQMDDVWDSYVDLTGSGSVGGPRILIDIRDAEHFQRCGNHAGAHAYNHSNLICFTRVAARNTMLDILFNNQTCFLMLHELAHINARGREYNFDPESVANLKSAYAMESLGLISQSREGDSYRRSQVSASRWHYDWGRIKGFEHGTSQCQTGYTLYKWHLVNNAGWEPFKEAFRKSDKVNNRHLPAQQRGVIFYGKVADADGRGRELINMLPDGGRLYNEVKSTMTGKQASEIER